MGAAFSSFLQILAYTINLKVLCRIILKALTAYQDPDDYPKRM